MNKPLLFDERITKIHRKRSSKHWEKADFLFKEFAVDLVDRLHSPKQNFDLALDWGARLGYVQHAYQQVQSQKVKQWHSFEEFPCESFQPTFMNDQPPLEFETYDLITNLLNLHQMNHLEEYLKIFYHLLKPGGFFVANFFGGDHFIELKQAFVKAENETLSGMSPRFIPMIDVKTAGDMLFSAGFKIPTADVDRLKLNYQDPMDFLKDIQYMGQSNNLAHRLKTPKKPKEYLHCLLKHLKEIAAQDDGSIMITCEVITLTGWRDDGTMDPKTKGGMLV